MTYTKVNFALINISETKGKHKVNNKMLFSCHQVKHKMKKKKWRRNMAKSKLVKANEKIAKEVICTGHVYDTNSGMECVSARGHYGSGRCARIADYGNGMEKDGK